jgi:16S rRNA (uracil1498-N3)-methyltransferase
VSSGRFFVPRENIHGDSAFIDGDEHFHLSQVLRKKAGARALLFDSEGRWYQAKIRAVEAGKTHFTILGISEVRHGLRLGLGQSLLKSDKMEWIIQKGTELGLTDFFPLQSERSIVRPDANRDKKMSRWRRITREAVKQCGRSGIPHIHSPDTVPHFLRSALVPGDEWFFLSERGGLPLHKIIRDRDSLQPPESVLLLCGPEGGWTNGEEKNILGFGFQAVSLGPIVMRAETAALTALAIVSHFWSRSV